MGVDVLRENQLYVESLQSTIERGGLAIETLPRLLVEIVDGDRWRRRIARVHHSEVAFDDFAVFTSTKTPDGLGISLDQLRKLCRDHPDAIDAIDRATQRRDGNPQGTNQYTAGTFDNVQGSTAPTGNSAEAAIRRLRFDRPDLHARVLAKDLSPHAAMREAGFRKPTLTVRLDDPAAMAGSIARHVDRVFIAELIAELHHVADGMEN